MASSTATAINIDVVYAEPHRAVERCYRVEPPATLDLVLRLAAADPAFAGIEIRLAAVGVFGRPLDAGHILNDRDRVEIYRPLAADPKSARRARVSQARRKPKT